MDKKSRKYLVCAVYHGKSLEGSGGTLVKPKEVIWATSVQDATTKIRNKPSKERLTPTAYIASLVLGDFITSKWSTTRITCEELLMRETC